MCTRGVFQLRKLSIYFCDFGGSSAGVREFLMSEHLKGFMEENKHIDFNFIVKRNYHPFVTGGYINGYLKDITLRSVDQQRIISVFNTLRNQLGRKSFQASGSRIYHPIKSIQGKWMPNMFNTYPRAQLEAMHSIPRVHFQQTEKQIKHYQLLKKKDAANILLGLDHVNAKDGI